MRHAVRRAAFAAIAQVVVALLTTRPAAATGGGLILRITQAQADFDTHVLVISGQNLARTSSDLLSVSLSGEALTLVSQTPVEVVAQLPAGIEPGTYRLVVVRNTMIPGADAMDVTIGAAGPQGLTGPAGPKGDTGETGPPGLPGAKGDTGEKGDRGQNGPKGLNWRSVWEAGTSYSTADAVSHEGASWVALRDSTGVPPADGADWSLLAAHGEPGERGADGQQGIPGNLALAGLSCQGGTFLRGFSSTGTLLCANASAQCGNGIVEPGEQCDDGNIFSGDGCSRLCRIEVCGNGILDPPYEQCDDGNTRSGDGCSAFCTYERCGNGILDPGEECDDGNTVDGDGCSAACRIEP